MNFRFINPHNVRWFVPAWAVDPFILARTLDNMLAQHLSASDRQRWDAPLDFWVVCQRDHDGGWAVSLKQIDDDGLGAEDVGKLFLESDEWSINLPLNGFLKGSPPAAGAHCVYYHYFETPLPAAYTGVTKQRWFDRYAQHVSSAKCGSPYLFHRAIREHGHKKAMHRVLLSALSEDAAMHFEEDFVARGTLYPLGLNMIPGGRSGIRYLHTLGIRATSAESRDLAVQDALSQEVMGGRPNPLCAARWESDPDFASRVICGHSGRLTAEQVRTIRLLAGTGRCADQIAVLIGDSVRRVTSVLTGKRYGRVL